MPFGYELIDSNFSKNWKRKEARKPFENERFFFLAGEKNTGSDNESRKRRVRGVRRYRGDDGATGSPFSSASERASERALVSREFDRYSGINS